jgi:hypothetical protein
MRKLAEEQGTEGERRIRINLYIELIGHST